ncbi:MAG TPA: hypothetical protein VJS45_18430, partial [Acidimicrobiia bacterium]|nr:hypothetical protein [Acidimicrobiia bacterium]
GTPPTGPASVLVLGALAAVTVAFVPGGLAGLAQRVTSRVAPNAAPVPAMTGASASAGFIDGGRGRDRFSDDPYAADDPFADDA